MISCAEVTRTPAYMPHRRYACQEIRAAAAPLQIVVLQFTTREKALSGISHPITECKFINAVPWYGGLLAKTAYAILGAVGDRKARQHLFKFHEIRHDDAYAEANDTDR